MQVPLQKGEPSTSESLLMEASRQEAVSPYYVAFCNEVGMGVGMMHLLGLLRQRRGDADAAFLVKKVLKDAEEMPMQVVPPP